MGWRQPAKRIWCSECTGLDHTEEKTTAKAKEGVYRQMMREIKESRTWRGKVIG